MVTNLQPKTVQALLRYDRDTGKLFWKPRPLERFWGTEGRTPEHACANWNSRYAGKEAFTAQNGQGYFHGQILYQTYKAHRVIWCIEMGMWPEAQIDHIDANPSNNRWENLREATQSENNCNRVGAVISSSKYKGVAWYERKRKWEAYIQVDGRKKSLGHFTDETEAARAYDQAARVAHGRFAKLNFPLFISPKPEAPKQETLL